MQIEWEFIFLWVAEIATFNIYSNKVYTPERINNKIASEVGVDLDWFLTDNEGNVAIVASGGGLLPDSIALNLENIQKASLYFRSLPEVSEIELQPSVVDEISDMDEWHKEAYLKDIRHLGRRGLFYFDKSNLGSYMDFRYFLKAIPQNPINIAAVDLEIASILSATRVEFSLKNLAVFEVKNIA